MLIYLVWDLLLNVDWHCSLQSYATVGSAHKSEDATGVECRWGRQQSRFWAYIWLHCMLLTLQLARCYKYGAAGPWFHKLWHLSQVVSCGACWWQETKTKCLWQEISALCQRQQNTHLIARIDKSVAYVTNNKSLCSTFCTIEANYWQTRSILRPLCDSRATCSIPNIAAIFRRGPLTGRQMQSRVWKIPIFEPYLASSHVVSAATARCYQHGAARLLVVVSGRVCWCQDTMMKCLWQGASTLCRRQQNSI